MVIRTYFQGICDECDWVGDPRPDVRTASRDEERHQEERHVPDAVCEGFEWVGQPLTHCERCGHPYWEHDHERRNIGLVFIDEAHRARVKAHWRG